MDFQKSVGFLEIDFNSTLFSKILENVFEGAKYIAHEEISLLDGSGYVTNLGNSSNDSAKRVLGFRAFRLHYRKRTDSLEKRSVNVVFKIKVKGSQKLFGDLLIKNGYDKLGNAISTKPFDSLSDSALKEIAFYNVQHPVWKAIRPAVFTTLQDNEKDVYMVAMEELRIGSFTHKDTINDVSQWKHEDIKDVLQGIAPFHALYYGKPEDIPVKLKEVMEATNVSNPYSDPSVRSFYKCVSEHNLDIHANLFEQTGFKIVQNSLDSMNEVCAILGESPMALVHNDFSIRNLCLRKHPEPNESRLCVYDWENVRISNPQHDIAEFIAFVLQEDGPVDSWSLYLDIYRESLLRELENLGTSRETLETVSNRIKFDSVFHMCVLELLWNRLGTYIFLSEFLAMPFVPRVVKNVLRYVRHFSQGYPFLKISSI